MIRHGDTTDYKVLSAPVDKGQAGGTRQHCRAQPMLTLVYGLKRPVLIKNIGHLTVITHCELDIVRRGTDRFLSIIPSCNP